MSAETAMRRGQRAAEALMVDECEITAAGEGPPQWDDAEGIYVPPARAVVYRGPCKVQRTALEPRDVEVGERVAGVEVVRVNVPLGVLGVRVDHRIEITAAVYDPDLVRLRMRVESVGTKTWATARRLRCVEET